MWLNDSASTCTSSRLVAETSIRGSRSPASTRVGDRGHPPQRSRHPRAGEVRGDQREHEHHATGQQERPRDAVLGVLDHGSAARRRRDDRADGADRQAPLEHAHPPHVRDARTRVAEVRHLQRRGRRCSPRPARPGSRPARGRRAPEHLRVVADRARAPGTSTNSSVEVAVYGCARDVAGRRGGHGAARRLRAAAAPRDSWVVCAAMSRSIWLRSCAARCPGRRR